MSDQESTSEFRHVSRESYEDSLKELIRKRREIEQEYEELMEEYLRFVSAERRDG